MGVPPVQERAHAKGKGKGPQEVRITVLGSGTSTGVPVIGCNCPVCISSDPRNRRHRASVLVSYNDRNVLIDTATDLRQQALDNRIESVNAVLFTHTHADHIHGIDELRAFNFMQGAKIPLYGSAASIERIRRSFEYIFTKVQAGGGKPILKTHVIDGAFDLFGERWIPVDIYHGRLVITGFRVGGFAYLTDCSAIPEESFALLEDLDVLILGALRYTSHPTHFSIPQAVEAIGRIGPRRAYLTHLSHRVDHAELLQQLPEGVEPAWDGLVIDI